MVLRCCCVCKVSLGTAEMLRCSLYPDKCSIFPLSHPGGGGGVDQALCIHATRKVMCCCWGLQTDPNNGGQRWWRHLSLFVWRRGRWVTPPPSQTHFDSCCWSSLDVLVSVKESRDNCVLKLLLGITKRWIQGALTVKADLCDEVQISPAEM